MKFFIGLICSCLFYTSAKAQTLHQIIKTYYQIIEALDPSNSSLIELKKQQEQIQVQWERYQEECQGHYPAECPKLRFRFYQESIKFEPLLLLSMQKLNFSSHNFAALLDRLKAEDQLYRHFMEMLGTIEKNIVEDKQFNFSQIDQSLHSQRTSVGIYIIHSIPEQNKKPFLEVWGNFISPLEQMTSEKQSWASLKIKVNQLNFSWHEFRMKMTVQNRKLPREIFPMIERIQQDWGNVVRKVHHLR